MMNLPLVLLLLFSVFQDCDASIRGLKASKSSKSLKSEAESKTSKTSKTSKKSKKSKWYPVTETEDQDESTETESEDESTENESEDETTDTESEDETTDTESEDEAPKRKFKNVILMIPDGCDESVLSLARWYKEERLQVDELASSKVHPYMANSIMTDSAPGGTAYATGMLTSDKFISVGPRRDDLLSHLDESELWDAYAPIPTNLEAAQRMGMSTGLASTSRFTHATPAAFASHVDSRSKEQEIAKQMVFNGVDVVMGGGRENMIPKASCFNETAPDGDGRDDCLDLETELEMRGYDLCSSKDELMALDGEKAWCTFADSHMFADIDRKVFDPSQPALSEVTTKAIEILNKNDEGFFLMVEGSQVDWAGHSNDPIWMVTEFIAWDDAVRVAVDFAKEDGETLVVALPDHNTGGMKIGNFKHEYTDRTVELVREPLLKMQVTSTVVAALMGEETPENLKAAVSTWWGIDLKDEDVTKILEYNSNYRADYKSSPFSDYYWLPISYALGRVVSEEYTVIGWTSHGHLGETVPMWMYGMDPVKGLIENTDVGQLISEVMGGIDGLADELFVDLDTTDLSYTVDASDVKNEHVLVEGFVFPLNTDYFLNSSGERVMFEGLTIYAPQIDKVYLSANAIEQVKSLQKKINCIAQSYMVSLTAVSFDVCLV